MPRVNNHGSDGGVGYDLAVAVIKKFPNAGALTLARKIYAANPEVFLNLEAARTRIRYLLGATGKVNRAARRRAGGEGMRARRKSGGRTFEALPPGLQYMDEWEPYVINAKKVLILADIHIPYHDLDALKCALDYGVACGCDHLLYLGDAMDFYSASFWEKDPRKRRFQEELNTWYKVAKVIQSAFPKATFKEGNHEERLWRYMARKAPELLDLEVLSLPELLHLPGFVIEHVGDKRIVKLGHLSCLHGHEWKYGISSPVNPARGYYLRAKATCIAGHLHQTSEHSEKDLHESIVTCWSLGCLCDMRADYARYNKWNHGFAVVTVDDDGEFEVDNKRIFDGRVF